ncbi:MAG: hypothetical protein J5767_11745 [Paludibacteraceae bacterium]|nr:hypothetical protein [Paludibacteraceae bacterium]
MVNNPTSQQKTTSPPLSFHPSGTSDTRRNVIPSLKSETALEICKQKAIHPSETRPDGEKHRESPMYPYQ